MKKNNKNNWNDMQEEDDTIIHDTTSHAQYLYQNSKQWL